MLLNFVWHLMKPPRLEVAVVDTGEEGWPMVTPTTLGGQNNGTQLNIDIINTIVNLQILAVRIAIVTKKLWTEDTHHNISSLKDCKQCKLVCYISLPPLYADGGDMAQRCLRGHGAPLATTAGDHAGRGNNAGPSPLHTRPPSVGKTLRRQVWPGDHVCTQTCDRCLVMLYNTWSGCC